MSCSDSAGGVIECRIQGVPAGIGDPVFEKLDANLAKAVLSIGAVKAFEIGDGFQVSNANGSTNNDSFFAENGEITKKSNHAGGILGGISDGAEIAREIADIMIGSDDLYGLVTLKRLSNALVGRIHGNYRVIVGFNTALILLGVGGFLQPASSALLHNTSTLAISLKSMQDLL